VAKTRIVIEADNKASKEIDKLKNQFRSLKQEPRTLNDLVKGLGQIPIPAAAAATALASVAKFAQEAYAKFLAQAQAEKTLSATIRKISGGYDVLSQSLFKVANEIQALTNIDDTKIIAGMTRLAEVGTQDLPRAAQAIADLSIVMGSTEQASDALAVAFVNPERGLRQLINAGVQFTNAQKEQIKTLVESGRASEAQAIILAQVEARYKGIAEEVGKSPQGQVQRLQNAIDDFMISFGRWIDNLGIVSATLQGISSILESVTKAMDDATNASINQRAARQALTAVSTGARIAQADLERLAQMSDEALKQVLESQSAQIRSYRLQLEDVTARLQSLLSEFGAQSVAQLTLPAVRQTAEALERQRAQLERLVNTETQRLERVQQQTREFRQQAQVAETQARQQRLNEEQARRRQELIEKERAQAESLLRSLEAQYIKQSEIERVLKSIAEVEGLLSLRSLTRSDRERAQNLRNILEAEKERLIVLQQQEELEKNKTEIQRQLEQIFAESEAYEKNRLEFIEIYNKAQEEGNERLLLALNKINDQYSYLEKISDVWDEIAVKIDKATKPLDLMLEMARNLSTVFNEIANQRVRSLEKELDAVKGNLSAELKLRKDMGEETAQYEIDRQNQIRAVEEKLEYERKKAARDAAIAKKIIDFATASISGAKAIIEALAVPPAPNIVLGSLTGALVATQLAAISATPIPELAEGGIVRAVPGGRLVRVAEAGKDEAVIPLDKAKIGRSVTVQIGTLIGAPTRETALTIKRSLDKLEREGIK